MTVISRYREKVEQLLGEAEQQPKDDRAIPAALVASIGLVGGMAFMTLVFYFIGGEDGADDGARDGDCKHKA